MPITRLVVTTYHGEEFIEGEDLEFLWNEHDPDSSLQIRDYATDLIVAVYASKTWRSVKVHSVSEIEEPEQSEGDDAATQKEEAA